jgi:hypothetical protein
MNRKGVCYDVGRVMGINWRPHFEGEQVHRELEIIKNDLHCNSVRIHSRDLSRLTTAADHALNQGLEVWLSPEEWDKSPADTLAYLTKAAQAAENLRQHWPDRIVFVLGGELTLFMQGIVEAKTLQNRVANPSFMAKVKAGEHNKPLNDFLAKARAAVTSIYHGKTTYASLVWEAVDWSNFDFVGLDHYMAAKIEDKYVEMLRPAFSNGKPVVITEFGFAATRGGIGEEGMLSSAGLGGGIIDGWSQVLHYGFPLIGRFIRPHLNGEHIRDEAWQAKKLVETLGILDDAGVDGTFVFEFLSQIKPYSDDAKHDLDMASLSLVKYYEKGNRGATYPDMPWEPKEAFRAVADYYAKH